MKSRALIILTLLLSALVGNGVAWGQALSLSYSGRLTEADGKPVSGPVALQVAFFRSADGNDQVSVGPFEFADVGLQSGAFQIEITMSDADFHTLFPANFARTWIELKDVTHGKTYPRQAFSPVPFALKVPVDEQTLTYSSDGKLVLKSTGETGAAVMAALNQTSGGSTFDVDLLPPAGGDVQGNLDDLTVSSLQGRAVANATPVGGEFLKWNAAANGGLGQWEPGSVAGAAGGTVTSVSTGQGLTGGDITGVGTIDLKLNTGGGLSKTLGVGSDELGIPSGGLELSMLSTTDPGCSTNGFVLKVAGGVWTCAADSDSSQSLTSAELDQLETIGTTTISASQWGYLGNMSAQPLESESDPRMQSLSTAEVDQLEAIDSTTITTTQWGYLGAMSSQPLESESDPRMQTLSAGEVDQLENIETTTISTAQWGYIGTMTTQPADSGANSDIASLAALTSAAPVDASGTDTPGTDLILSGGQSTGTGTGGSLIFKTAPSGGASGTGTNPAVERVRVDADGNVGIGTNDPDAKLEVAGTPGVDGIMFPDGTLQTTAAAMSVLARTHAGGRLTLTSLTPVTSADVVAASTVYYTPHVSDVIGLFDGTKWVLQSFSELSLALSGLVSDTNYDVFVYDNGGSPALELGPAWTDAATRSTAIARQNGIWVKSGDATRRYLGTLRTTSPTTTEDSHAKRFLWNAYNRKLRIARTRDDGDWFEGGNGVWSALHGGDPDWKHEFVIGIAEDAVKSTAQIWANAFYSLSIARDGTTFDRTESTTAESNDADMLLTAVYHHYIPAGYHYLQAIETAYTTGLIAITPSNGGACGSGYACIQAGMTTELWQ